MIKADIKRYLATKKTYLSNKLIIVNFFAYFFSKPYLFVINIYQMIEPINLLVPLFLLSLIIIAAIFFYYQA